MLMYSIQNHNLVLIWQESNETLPFVRIIDIGLFGHMHVLNMRGQMVLEFLYRYIQLDF